MEAPQKRARDEAAATERPNKKYKCEPPLDTAAKQEDLSALSKPELRALVASARALARRADGEIAARHASFPRCLPPQFVMSWLPLGDLPCALRVSKAWHGASEALFQIVFRENGLVDRVGTWRESVFSYAREIRWAGSQPSYFPWKELNGPATVTNREKTLMYFRGRAIRLWPGCTTSWRVLVEKPSDGSGTYINAVGFAILDPINPGKVLAAYEWNEDGQPYPMDAVRCRNAGGFPVRDLKIYRGVRPLFESGDTIEIKVTLENGHIMAAVEVNDEPTDGEGTRRGIEMRHYDKCTMLRVEPTERDGRKDDVAPVLGREGTLVVAPFCDLSRGSSASLTWSDLANPRINRVIGSSEPLTWSELASLGNDLGGITWREYEDRDCRGKKKTRTRYEPRLAPPRLPPRTARNPKKPRARRAR